MIDLPPLGDGNALWHTLLDLNDHVPDGWALIGGQMTLLHVLEHGQQPIRLSRDLDLVADIRADPKALRRLADALITLGFEPRVTGLDEIAHRFIRAEAIVDPSPRVVNVRPAARDEIIRALRRARASHSECSPKSR